MMERTIGPFFCQPIVHPRYVLLFTDGNGLLPYSVFQALWIIGNPKDVQKHGRGATWSSVGCAGGEFWPAPA